MLFRVSAIRRCTMLLMHKLFTVLFLALSADGC